MKAIVSVVLEGKSTIGTYSTRSGSGEFISNEYRSKRGLVRYCLLNMPDGIYKVEIYNGDLSCKRPDETLLFWKRGKQRDLLSYDDYMQKNRIPFCELEKGDVFWPMSDHMAGKSVPTAIRGVWVKSRIYTYGPDAYNSFRLSDESDEHRYYFDDDQRCFRYPAIFITTMGGNLTWQKQ